MTLIKRNNKGLLSFVPTLSDFFENDNFGFEKLWKGDTIPAVNICESEKNYEIELAAPGMKKKDFQMKWNFRKS